MGNVRKQEPATAAATPPPSRASGKRGESKKALSHSKSNSTLTGKSKSSREIPLFTYHFFFLNAGDIRNFQGEHAHKLLLEVFMVHLCRNGTRRFSSLSLKGCHQVCFSVKLKARYDGEASHSTITKLKHGAKMEFSFRLPGIAMQIYGLSEITL